ncbi:protein prenylyltransferase [Polyplosphaeria fusca]|uniref:ER membrane protein complex subunit 2 n=1 Tax=Polyplosphaeria fusca TaxID=682080 RepID=A0A9P4UZ06_9PLEO|nr:protein prenylyltransferase [Polyplosphaeria fusca]
MAQTNLLSPPSTISPPTALQLSQKAPRIIANPPTSSLPWPLSLLFSAETPEAWVTHENALYACLRTHDDAAARQLLDRLSARFGESNERIITLRGIYEEATAKNNGELEVVFKKYEDILKQDPTNFGVRKRRVAVLKSLGRTSDAITALTMLVESSPTDLEAWAELGEMYAKVGEWARAIWCAEEVLLVMPNSWSAHAHLATLHYLSTQSSPHLAPLNLSLKNFARSIELNDSYLRGYYGLKLVCQKLIPLLSESSSVSKRNQDEDGPPPNLETVKKLEELATSKLAEIVRRYQPGTKEWQGYDGAEVIAARELLNRDANTER